MIVYGTSNFNESEIFDFMLNYFSIIYQKREISVEETRLFLMLYLEYILRLNGIDSRQFSTNINLAKKLVVSDVEAYLKYVEKQSQFDVYFLREDLKLASHNNFVYSNAPKNKRLVARMVGNNNAQNYFNIKLANSGHLFHHIVQLITNKGLYLDYIKEKQELQNFKKSLIGSSQKSLIRETNRRLKEIDFVHPIEMQATMLSYKYMASLLKKLMERTNDAELKKFLFEMKCMLDDDREDKYMEYLAHNLTRRSVNRLVENCDFEETTIPLKGTIILK